MPKKLKNKKRAAKESEQNTEKELERVFVNTKDI